MTSPAETFALMYDEEGNLTPYGLAYWMDDEGGLVELLDGKGAAPFIEAGVSRVTIMRLARTLEDVRAALREIGAEL